MSVNFNQYRGAVGVFNSKFFIDKKHRISFSNNPFPFSVNLIIFECFSIILTSSYTYFVLIFFFLLNFKINSPKKLGEKTLVPKLNPVKTFQYVSGTQIVYLPTISLKCRYRKLSTPFTSMISFVFRKLI